MFRNRSRITGRANATTSTEASQMLHSVLGPGWQKSLELPRLLDILEQDPAYEISLLKPGERNILLKKGALRNLQESASLDNDNLPPEVPTTSRSLAASHSSLACEAQALQRAVDYWWPGVGVNPEQFLKHALAAHMAGLRQGTHEEVVKLDIRAAGKQADASFASGHVLMPSLLSPMIAVVWAVLAAVSLASYQYLGAAE
jgi:hypothetical protein